jgi:hypothetical protein
MGGLNSTSSNSGAACYHPRSHQLPAACGSTPVISRCERPKGCNAFNHATPDAGSSSLPHYTASESVHPSKCLRQPIATRSSSSLTWHTWMWGYQGMAGHDQSQTDRQRWIRTHESTLTGAGCLNCRVRSRCRSFCLFVVMSLFSHTHKIT